MIPNTTVPGVDENTGCTLSHTGKCKDCPHYRCMPGDIADARTGQVYSSGSMWDCVFMWSVLATWDAGRQSFGVHEAVSDLRNQTVQRQERLLAVVEGGPRVEQIEHADDTH